MILEGAGSTHEGTDRPRVGFAPSATALFSRSGRAPVDATGAESTPPMGDGLP